MSEGPAAEQSPALPAKRYRADGSRQSLIQWLNTRLDVANVPLVGIKVGHLADRLAAAWPLAGEMTGLKLKKYFKNSPAESLRYLLDDVKLDEPTARRLRDGPLRRDYAPPAAADGSVHAFLADGTRQIRDQPRDSDISPAGSPMAVDSVPCAPRRSAEMSDAGRAACTSLPPARLPAAHSKGASLMCLSSLMGAVIRATTVLRRMRPAHLQLSVQTTTPLR
jgi:hypothetical protein